MASALNNLYVRLLKSRHPFEYSQITDRLFVAAWPVGENYTEIVDQGVRLVINMDWISPDPKLGQPPLQLLTLETRDSPLTPMPLDKLWTGVNAASETIAAGGKVMVYCKGGVHRSVVMACCILISQGYSAGQAISLVKQKRPVARPDDGHYMQVIEEFETAWKAKQA
jgi:protein tyrosine phosphatase (PTP) superfamily phosphohydrolase (DUF442 family)